MNKLSRNLFDPDIQSLGKEIERFIKEDANLSTEWVRSESHFGAEKFTLFKKGFKPHLASPSSRTSPVPSIEAIHKPSNAGTTITSGNC